jgi:transposase-like protein
MMGQPAVVSLEALQVETYLREGGLNLAHVATLAELEGRWPPILVTRHDHVVIDGHHRVAAAQHLGLSEIPALFFDGSPQEAYVEFVRCNVGHGLPLTLPERKRAVGHILVANPDWSDRRLAKLCALSPTTVGRIRAELADRPDDHFGQSDTRIGQNGRVRSLHPERMRARVAEALAARPQSSLRAVAQAVGVSPETVRSVRKSLHSDGTGSRAGAKDSHTDEPSVADIAWLSDMLGRGRPATAMAPWQEDRALSSLDCGDGFVAWFDGASVEEADCWRYLREVPLSRVYMVADEARRRARTWSTFAAALEDRVNQRAATN